MSLLLCLYIKYIHQLRPYNTFLNLWCIRQRKHYVCFVSHKNLSHTGYPKISVAWIWHFIYLVSSYNKTSSILFFHYTKYQYTYVISRSKTNHNIRFKVSIQYFELFGTCMKLAKTCLWLYNFLYDELSESSWPCHYWGSA